MSVLCDQEDIAVQSHPCCDVKKQYQKGHDNIAVPYFLKPHIAHVYNNSIRSMNPPTHQYIH